MLFFITLQDPMPGDVVQSILLYLITNPRKKNNK
jgi:hypothetical protein